ncbi:MAG: glycosyltransferase family 39 protein [Planctomycetaceae bacterium]
MNNQDVASAVKQKQALAGLVLIAALFLALRVPVMYHQPGGYDEDFYAVPGLTILRTGIPQLPHVPARNPESVFLYADTALYSEPPLYFYFQAAFYSVLPHVYGTGRLASAIAGLGIVACVYFLSRAAGAGVMAALAGAALLSLSRWFYFPAICARPDTLCGLFGLAAILALVEWRRDSRMTSLLLVGILLGLGGLTHFFAIIYAMQIGLVVAWWSRGWKRLVNFGVVTATAIVVFCAWVPLITMAPDVFKSQLGNQLGGTSGGPMWLRVALPWASLRSQLTVMWEHIGAIQCVIPTAATLLSTYLGITSRNPVLTLVCGFAWSAMYLICVMVGPDHPVYGYWVYPAGLMFVALAYALDAVARALMRSRPAESAERMSLETRSCAGMCALAIVVALSFVPVRTGESCWCICSTGTISTMTRQDCAEVDRQRARK